MKSKFIIASNNKGKIAEFDAMLSKVGFSAVSQSDAGIDLDVEETGITFAENSFLKASAAASASGCPSIADDSGLVVDALNGEPGVYSARYGGEKCATDTERYELLLKNMSGVKDRSAKFVCCLTCVFPNGDVIQCEGECEGEIMAAPAGDGGFGYDPIFRPRGMGCSMAQLTGDEKNKISHRSKALMEFLERLREYYADK